MNQGQNIARGAGHRAQGTEHRARGAGGSDRSCRSCKLRSETTKSRSAGSCKSLIMRCLTDSKR